VDGTHLPFDPDRVPIDREPRRLDGRVFAESATTDRSRAETTRPVRNAELDPGRPFAPAAVEGATPDHLGLATERFRPSERSPAALAARSLLD